MVLLWIGHVSNVLLRSLPTGLWVWEHTDTLLPKWHKMKFTDSQVPLQGTTFSYPELFCLRVRSQNCFLVFLLSITQWGSWADARTDWETFTEWFQLELIQALGQIIRVHQDTLSHTETDINDISYAPIATWQHFQSWTPLQESFDMLFATDSKPFLDSNNEIRSSRFDTIPVFASGFTV